jgi:hypothetical protein
MTSHWLHGNSIPKIGGHYFWPGLIFLKFVATMTILIIFFMGLLFGHSIEHVLVQLGKSCCNLEEDVGFGKSRV